MSSVKRIIVKEFFREFEQSSEDFLLEINLVLNEQGAFIHSFTPHFNERGSFDAAVAVLVKGDKE